MSSADDEARSFGFLGIKLTPVINVSRQRRFQTLVVLLWSSVILVCGWGSIVLSVFLLFTRYYWISAAVYAWMIYTRNTPHQGGRRWKRAQDNKVWNHMRDYFPVQLHKTCDLDPKQNYIFGFHPHGVLVVSAYVNFCTGATGFSKKFPGITPYLMGLNGFFKFPLISDLIMLSGFVAASRESFDWILGKMEGPGNAVVIVVGGGVEVLEAIPKHYALYLSRRKGFIRKALQHGAYLVPVYSFGETDVYYQHLYKEDSIIRRLQIRFNKIVGYPPAMFHGRGIFNYNAGILPFRRKIDTVVGKPIAVGKKPKPTTEEVDELHKTYVDALVALFDEHKTKFGLDENQDLTII